MNDVQHIFDKDILWKKEDIDGMPSSPLAFSTEHMPVFNMSLLQFQNFDVLPEKMILNNNGRTVTLSGIWLDHPFILGLNLPDKYNFSHLHFHWTDNNDGGSEHIINGQKYTLEMHAIFFKNSCHTIFEAESQRNGCITLAYLFDINENEYRGIDNITNHLYKVYQYRDTTEIPVFPLSNLMDIHGTGEYFTYIGKSEKLKGANGVSQWVVFTKIRGVSRNQMELFRLIRNKREHPIKRNCRKALHALSTETYGPHLVRSSRRQIRTASIDKIRSVETVLSTPIRVRPRTTEMKLKQSNPKVNLPVKSHLIADSWNNIEPGFSCVKPTKTLLLRRKFNQEKIVSLSRTTKNAPWKMPVIVKSSPKTTVYQPPVVNGSKPSWK